MSSQNFRNSLSTYQHHLLNPINMLHNQLIRYSFTTNASIPLSLRQCLGKSSRRLSSISTQIAEHLFSLVRNQKCLNQKSKTTTLKQTLSALQQKISKAKKRLHTSSNNICLQLSEQESRQKIVNYLKDDIKQQDTTTTLSSLDKITFLSSCTTVTSYSQLKTYYLSNIPSALEGKNSKVLQHLILSFKILRNQAKIQTPTFSKIEKYKVNLVRDKGDANKKTLLIDLDETLIHSKQDPSQPYDIALPIQLESGNNKVAYVSLRPFAISFLKKMSKHFQIVAFTASHQNYADAILNEIDPQREYIKHRLYRRSCIEIYENIYAKDLRIVNRDLSSLVLVDNAPFSYIYQLQNGIPIVPYYEGQDNQLFQLEKYLEQVAKCTDVRELNKKTFKLHQYNKFTDIEELVRNLYLSHF